MKYFALIILACFLPWLLAEPCGSGEKVTFCAVGDVLLDRGVRTMINQRGVDYPFEKTAPFLNSHDLTFCNLECPISTNGAPLNKPYVFRGDPSFVEGLKKSGLRIFSLANNHTLDYGREALLETKEILENHGLHAVGAGNNQGEASKGKVIAKNGANLAFLAFVTMPLEGIVYSEDLPGPAQIDIEGILDRIKSLRGTSDYIIVSFHWGKEYSSFPSTRQKEYARRVIDHGADLVLGHHPHTIQSIEKYKGNFIIYSLGSFVFDQSSQPRNESFVFVCTFTGEKIVSPHIIPIIIKKCQPNFAKGKDFKRIVSRVKSISKGYGVNFEERKTALFLK
jgi:poly-gamma-glutamate synthesis protein (capsule biosynthesis protein)